MTKSPEGGISALEKELPEYHMAIRYFGVYGESLGETEVKSLSLPDETFSQGVDTIELSIETPFGDFILADNIRAVREALSSIKHYCDLKQQAGQAGIQDFDELLKEKMSVRDGYGPRGAKENFDKWSAISREIEDLQHKQEQLKLALQKVKEYKV
ncbi:MAG: hypothetical protein COT81_05830 [Candidatus Buchananbacteria bacterium CG10_big_fil_rev_8_21_14_0_10_42_9]|uniref:Uncharacterized protein n=1 Tax=Candidatus Buchananbacteria bacterium CG10_big_fil_rev_8_21_14_0_10_42_9 TaxID=1974526 RepID=A0A2H0VZR6_9BACT|nr:MAG: hypothetical protein COT81_05830 [Candidatus Buchananbacteria bacterium CG10_big_fil_rev_8_21_14_0_10_42_9]